MKILKKIVNLLFHRVVLVALMILLQLIWLMLMLVRFSEYFVYFYGISTVIALGTVLYIINCRSNPGYKIAWITLVLLVPLFGPLIYLLLGGNRLSKRYRRKLTNIQTKQQAALPKNTALLEQLEALEPAAASQSHYLQEWADCPPYMNTYTEYLPSGESKFASLLDELRAAKRYIFLEYFIVQEGLMWNSILEILVEKARQGLDVRLIYDDMGCSFTLPRGYDKKLRELGIKCAVFNRFIPVLSSRFNNRDHRKIVVIDGLVGYTGGINLADEYINAYEKYGHWKDTAILLKGEAVWSLTVMFLTMWDYIEGIEEDYTHLKPAKEELQALSELTAGFVQPYSDNPLDEEAVGENVYLNLINKAERYIYIATPYLVLDNEMVTALTAAAKSGLDVRIMMPHIADKWYVFAVSRAYYEILQEAGVRIYEYTPGFVHAKVVVADDKYATVGTINFDYRSLYLHFECGCWMYCTTAVAEVKEDFLNTLELCQMVTLAQSRSVPFLRRLGRALLRAFAPLM